MTASRLILVGVAGPELRPEERAVLSRHPPAGVILFRRNVSGVAPLRTLVEEIRGLPGGPLVFLDQEGGPVDRLRDLFGPSISARRAHWLGEELRAGELAGECCAFFGVDVDLAPVVDLALPGKGGSILGERCFGSDASEVEQAARQFLAGLESYGVAGVLKHFPGLGRGEVDSHERLPRMPGAGPEFERDLAPFERMSGAAPGWLATHAAFGDGPPATFDRHIATGLARDRLGFAGVLIADDLEMGALASFGELPERAARAAEAGCDILPICHSPLRLLRIAEEVGKALPPERLKEALGRVEYFRDDVARIRARRRHAPRSFGDIAGDVAALYQRGLGVGG